MSGFEDLGAYRAAALRAGAGGTFLNFDKSLPVIQSAAGPIDKLMYAVGVPEELLVKGIGGLISNDPKYDFGTTTSNWRSQVTFATGLRDTGIDGTIEGDDSFPLISTVLGIGLAVINPLDPLNKLKLGGLTRFGKASHLVTGLGKNAKQIFRGSKGRQLMDTIRLKKLLGAAERTAKTTKDPLRIKALQEIIPNLSGALKYSDDVNSVLAKSYAKGGTLDDFKLAGTKAEQVRKGQARIGLSSPFRADQLNFLGRNRDSFQDAAYGIPGLQHVEAAVIAGATKLKNVTADLFLKGLNAGGTAFGYAPNSVYSKELADVLQDDVSSVAATYEELVRNSEAIFNDMHNNGISVVQQEEIITELQSSTQFSRAENAVQMGALREAFENAKKNRVSVEDVTAQRARALRAGEQIDTIDGDAASAVQKDIIIRPSRLESGRAQQVVQEVNLTDVPWTRSGLHSYALTEDAVVVKIGHSAPPLQISKKDEVIGLPAFDEVEQAGERYLVSRRVPGRRRPASSPEGQGVQMGPDHVNNLEVFYAQLAIRKIGANGLSPEDLLVDEYGGFTLINPDRLKRYRSIEAAREASEDVLRAFNMKHATVDVRTEFTHLKSNAAARRVNVNAAKSMRLRRTTALPFDAQKGTMRSNVWRLLEDATNAEPERRMLQGLSDGVPPAELAAEAQSNALLLKANGVAQVRRHIREELAAGRKPKLEAIEVGATPDGFQIIEGQDRLVAAALEGIDVVEVKVSNRFDEVIQDPGLFVGDMAKIDEVFNQKPEQIARKGLEGHPAFNMLPRYKISRASGKAVLIRPKDLKSQAADSFQSELGRWTGLKTNGKHIDNRGLLTRLMAQNGGDTDVGRMALSQLVMDSDSASVLASRLAEVGVPIDTNSRNLRILDAEFPKLREAANTHLIKMAERGVFTERTLESLRHHFRGTVQFLDNQGNMVLANVAMTEAEMINHAQQVLSDSLSITEIIPASRITLETAEGVSSLRVGSLVKGRHPNIRVVGAAKQRFSDTAVEELQKKGVYVNRGEATKKALEEFGFDEVTGNILKRSPRMAAQYERPILGFVHTEGGELAVGVSARHTEGEHLISDLYSQGQVPLYEFGTLSREGLVVNGPATIARFPTLNLAAQREIRRRVQSIARQMNELGLSKKTPIHLNSPFSSKETWEGILGSKPTVGKVMDPDFQLTIPKEKQGMQLDFVMDAAAYIARVVRPSFSDPKMKQAFDSLLDIGDELQRLEIRAGIDTSQQATYFPRERTAQAEQALRAINKNFEKQMRKDAKLNKEASPFLKDRVLTDLSVHEVNELIRNYRKAGGKDPERIWVDTINRVLNGKDAATIHNLAKVLSDASVPLESGWFVEDAVQSFLARIKQSQVEVTKRTLINTLEERGVIHGIESKDLPAFAKEQDSVADEILKLNQLNAQEAAFTRQIDELKPLADVNVDDIDALKTQRDKLVKPIADAQVKIARMHETLAKNRSFLAKDIDLNGSVAYVDSTKAARLLREGVLDPSDITSGVDNGLTAIPIGKARAVLNGTDKVYFFSKEAEPAIERFFGLSKPQNKLFSKLLRLQAMWKEVTLFPVPAFHGRNFLSMGFQSMLGGVNQVESFRTSWQIIKQIAGTRQGTQQLNEVGQMLEKTVLTSDLGNSINAAELWKEFTNRGGVSGGFVYNEFHVGKFAQDPSTARIIRKFEKAGYVPSGSAVGHIVSDNFFVRKGKAASAAMEDRFRFAAFYDKWKRTGSFDQAMTQTKAMFYDYRDLTTFERKVMKGIMPFYSWSRFNVPRMVETLFTNPQFHYRARKFVNSWETGANDGVPPDENDIVHWMRDAFGIVSSKTKDGTYVVRAGEFLLPSYEMGRWLREPGKTFVNSLTPIMKIPMEMMTGTSLFTGKALEFVPGEPSRLLGRFATKAPTSSGALGAINLLYNDYVLKNTLRPVKEFLAIKDSLLNALNLREPGKRDPHPTLVVAGLDMWLGQSFNVDPSEARKINYRHWNRDQLKWRSAIRIAESDGRPEDANRLRQMFYQQLIEAPPTGSK